MGLFTYVKIAKELLPEKYRNLDNWQTKEVIEPSMETLEITSDKELLYLWNEYEIDDTVTEKKKSLIDLFGSWKVKRDHRNKLNFHGDMHVHNCIGNIWIELTARFTEGKLVNIEITESDLDSRRIK